MSYQICPKCNGTGKRFNPQPMTGIPMFDMASIANNGLITLYELKGMENICPVCKGKKIIDELTGNPPLNDHDTLEEKIEK